MNLERRVIQRDRSTKRHARKCIALQICVKLFFSYCIEGLACKNERRHVLNIYFESCTRDITFSYDYSFDLFAKDYNAL